MKKKFEKEINENTKVSTTQRKLIYKIRPKQP